MTETTARLENWYIRHGDIDNYVIIGNVYDDAKNRFHNGIQIRTSFISYEDYPVDSLDKGAVVETLNSNYLLGEKFVEENNE